MAQASNWWRWSAPAGEADSATIQEPGGRLGTAREAEAETLLGPAAGAALGRAALAPWVERAQSSKPY